MTDTTQQIDDSSNEQPSKRPTKTELRWLYFILEGKSAREAGKLVGLSPNRAQHSSEWIQRRREKSKKPYLWDIWRKEVDEQLRIYQAKAENIIRELSIIGFSSIDNFVEFPSKQDAIEAKKANDELISMLTEEPSDDKAKEPSSTPDLSDYKPGKWIRLKHSEDIPKELIPAIAEINETKEGIRIKLHSKLDALDMLARITKLYNRENDGEIPFDGEINIIVNGSKSPLLLNTQPIASNGDLQNSNP